LKLTGHYSERSIPVRGPIYVGEELLEDIKYTTPTAKATLIQAIREGRAKRLSDGSFQKDTSGTALWILAADEDDKTLEIGSLVTPGDPVIHCSHRSELSGTMLGSIL